MAPLDFEIISKLMRYVFTFLGVVIVWRSFTWLHKDRQATHKRLKALPDAGTIGILTVLEGSSELPEGSSLSVPPEGVLGFVRTCDIVVPVTDVVAQHLDFTFRNGKGLYIHPRRGCIVSVDGILINSRASSRRHPMQHGSLLQVGEALLQLGVFAGLDVQQADGVWNEALPGADSIPAQAPPPVIPHPAYPPQYIVDPSAAQSAGGAPIPCPPYPPQGNGQLYPPYPHQPIAPPITDPAADPRQSRYQASPPSPLTPPERRPGDHV